MGDQRAAAGFAGWCGGPGDRESGECCPQRNVAFKVGAMSQKEKTSKVTRRLFKTIGFVGFTGLDQWDVGFLSDVGFLYDVGFL